MVEPSIVLHDLLASLQETTIGEAIACCAIPHWFNVEIVAALRSNQEGNDEIVRSVSSLPFVTELNKGIYAYHASIRTHLLRQLWSPEKASDFAIWNRRSISYFAGRLGEEAAWRALFSMHGYTLEPIPVQPFVHGITNEERRELGLEIAYHLVALDDAKWMFLLRNFFSEARRYGDTNTCNGIYQMLGEYVFKFIPENQLWARYFGAVIDYLSGSPYRALRELFDVETDFRTLPIADGNSQLATDVMETLSEIKSSVTSMIFIATERNVPTGDVELKTRIQEALRGRYRGILTDEAIVHELPILSDLCKENAAWMRGVMSLLRHWVVGSTPELRQKISEMLLAVSADGTAQIREVVTTQLCSEWVLAEEEEVYRLAVVLIDSINALPVPHHYDFDISHEMGDFEISWLELD